MIFKIQVSIVTTHEKRRAIIYNEDRSALWEGNLSEPLSAIMAGRPKAFFHGDVTAEGIVALKNEALWQDW